MQLTDKQRATLQAIESMTGAQGYPPTLKELATAFSVAPTAILHRLQALQRKGLVTWEKGQPRTLRVRRAAA